MVHPSITKLKVPTFDLQWFKLIDKYFVLMAGGGGSTKSGVKNQVLLAKASDEFSMFFCCEGYLTDSVERQSLCSGLCCGIIEGSTFVCAIVENACVLVLITETEDQQLSWTRKAEFVADLHPSEPSVNCALILRKSRIITGGDDHTCRVWTVAFGVCSVAGTDLKVSMVGALTGHTAPVMGLSEHPQREWVCSASKDGSCRIWDVSTLASLYVLELQPGPGATLGLGGTNLSIESRGASFSRCGEFLYVLQSARRGSAHVTGWQVIVKEDDNVGEKQSTSLKQIWSKLVSNVPCTRLKMDESGQFLAVGGSNGAVTVLDTITCSKLLQYCAHDLPVTGLGFAPSHYSAAHGKLFVVTSCSADNKLACESVSERSQLWQLMCTHATLSTVLTLIFFCLAVVMQWRGGQLDGTTVKTLLTRLMQNIL